MSVVTIVGHVDSLGYLLCERCKPLPREDQDEFSYPVPVWSDNDLYTGEPCELCHEPLLQFPKAA